MSYQYLSKLQFPDPAQEVASNTDLRHAVVKASAYVTFALEESDTSHSRDLNSAMVAASTHNLPLDLTPDQYIERAVQELATAEGELPENHWYRKELREVRQSL